MTNVTSAATPLVLVTGASGYIATHVVQQLQEKGYRVRGTVRSLQNDTKVEPLRHVCPTAKYRVELVEADLLKADSWLAAVKDCQYVIHVASPVPVVNPTNEDEVIRPAVDGTLNVLRACHQECTVKRVVITSSMAAIECGFTARGDHIYTEADWTDIDNMSWVYVKSKTLAEKAAWDYHNKLPETGRFELAALNPGYVFGPALCGAESGSMEFAKKLLQREVPMVPELYFHCIDARDTGAAHVAAMTAPEAAGHRHILCTESLSFADVAKILDKEFGPQGYNIPTTTAPYVLLWLFSWFDKSLSMILPSIGKVVHFDNSRMQTVLGVMGRDVSSSFVDMAYSLIERGFVKKSSKYIGRNG